MMEKIQRIKNRRKLYTIFLLPIIFSCSEKKISDTDLNKIIDSIYNNNDSINRIINFKDINKNNWDKMYILDIENNAELENRNAVSRRLKIKYNGCKDDVLDRSILFLKDNKVSFEICSKFDETNSQDSQYIVSFQKIKYDYLTPENAIFKIVKKKYSGGYSLILQK